jgi:hypothetical protein
MTCFEYVADASLNTGTPTGASIQVIVCGFQGSSFIIYDIWQRYQYMCIEGGVCERMGSIEKLYNCVCAIHLCASYAQVAGDALIRVR